MTESFIAAILTVLNSIILDRSREANTIKETLEYRDIRYRAAEDKDDNVMIILTAILILLHRFGGFFTNTGSDCKASINTAREENNADY